MSDPNDPLAWVAKAEEDYTILGIAMQNDPTLTYGGWFHAQQCAEKYLKAVLIARQYPFPKTHDLRQLMNLCVQAGSTIVLDINRVDQLTFYASHVRYPGEDLLPEEAEEARQIASNVRQFIRALLRLP